MVVKTAWMFCWGATEMTGCSAAMERMCCAEMLDRTLSLVAVGQIGSMVEMAGS